MRQSQQSDQGRSIPQAWALCGSTALWRPHSGEPAWRGEPARRGAPHGLRARLLTARRASGALVDPARAAAPCAQGGRRCSQQRAHGPDNSAGASRA